MSGEEQELYQKFLALFLAYNQHTNLSAIRESEGIIEKHFIDSLQAHTIITSILSKKQEPVTLLDIGSGGGFPGIPLKIFFPELSICLLDSIAKKVRALEFFIQTLKLTHISALRARAEVLAKDTNFQKKYTIIVSRATAYGSQILSWARPFLAPNGKIILYKIPSKEEWHDMQITAKKLGLLLEKKRVYTLAGQERLLFVFGEKMFDNG